MSMCPVCSVAAVPKSTNYTDMRTAVGNSLNISANTAYRLDSKTLLLFSFGYSSFGTFDSFIAGLGRNYQQNFKIM